MNTVAVMGDAAKVAPPSPELCVLAAMIIAQSKGKPQKVTELVTQMRAFTDTHRQFSTVTRLRGAEYDTEVSECMEQAALWLERMEPFLLLMARR